MIVKTKGGDNMNDYRFGNFICSLRTEKGLSQSELGKMLGVSNKAVSKWENGRAKPNTRLIPQIAKIFDITVEELFACEHIEKNDEIERIQKYLSSQKKKFAVLFSITLSFAIILPLLLAEFIFVVVGFEIPEDVIGPLGAIGYVFAFVISITALIIFYGVFRSILSPSEPIYSKGLTRTVKIGILISGISFLYFFFHSIFYVIFLLLTEFRIVGVLLAITAFAFIISLGLFVFLTSVKFLLKIRLRKESKAKKNVTKFSVLPNWCKIFFCISLVLLPIAINIWVLALFLHNLLFIKYALIVLFWAFLLPVLIYQIINSKKKE